MRQNLGTALTVTSTEKWLSYLQAGQTFSKGAALAPGAAFAHIQLYNPAASGKTILLRNLFFDIGALVSVHINIDNVARVTDAGAGINMLSGAAAGVGHVRTEANAAEQGAVFNQWSPLANTVVKPYSDWVIQLGPAQGVTLVAITNNITLEAAFQWAEV